jgi:hypothetical protein
MKRLIGIFASVVALAVPVASHAAGSPRWVTYPSCTATASALTCTGRAAGVQPDFIGGLGYTEVALWAGVDYTCLDPYFETLWFGIPLANFVQAVIPFHNGSRFTVTFAPPPDGPGGPMGLVAECSVGPWLRGPDLNYYGVRLGIGWALSEPAGLGIEALSAPIGTVEAPH